MLTSQDGRPAMVIGVDVARRVLRVEFDGDAMQDVDLDLLPDAFPGDGVLIFDDRIAAVDLGVWSRRNILAALGRDTAGTAVLLTKEETCSPTYPPATRTSTPPTRSA